MAIYLYDDVSGLSDELFRRSLRVLSPERAEKACRFREAGDRKLSVTAYLLLAHGLRKEYGIMEKLDFEYGENGKPYLKNHPEIFFNLSHCPCGVVCALSSRETGVDIEAVTEYDPDLAAFVCNGSEHEQIRRAESPALEFAKLWTAKESVLKCTGQGISNDLKKILPDTRFRINTVVAPNGAYVISLCERR